MTVIAKRSYTCIPKLELQLIVEIGVTQLKRQIADIPIIMRVLNSVSELIIG